eukprot:2410756-Rhodomonas_salina.4
MQEHSTRKLRHVRIRRFGTVDAPARVDSSEALVDVCHYVAKSIAIPIGTVVRMGPRGTLPFANRGTKQVFLRAFQYSSTTNTLICGRTPSLCDGAQNILVIDNRCTIREVADNFVETAARLLTPQTKAPRHPETSHTPIPHTPFLGRSRPIIPAESRHTAKVCDFVPLCVLSLIFQAALNVDSTRLNMPDKPAMEDGGMVRMGTCGWSDDTLVKYHPQAFICMCEAMSVADPGYAAAARCGRFYPPRVIASGRTHPRTHPISSAVAVRPA